MFQIMDMLLTYILTFTVLAAMVHILSNVIDFSSIMPFEVTCAYSALHEEWGFPENHLEITQLKHKQLVLELMGSTKHQTKMKHTEIL